MCHLLGYLLTYFREQVAQCNGLEAFEKLICWPFCSNAIDMAAQARGVMHPLGASTTALRSRRSSALGGSLALNCRIGMRRPMIIGHRLPAVCLSNVVGNCGVQAGCVRLWALRGLWVNSALLANHGSQALLCQCHPNVGGINSI